MSPIQPPRMETSGRLARLVVHAIPGTDTPWRFTREEGPDPAFLLMGRAPEEAARLAPRIFNLCGSAHGLAAARALGLDTEADRRATFEAMGRETLRDHALAILDQWPRLLGAPSEREMLAQVARGRDRAGLAAVLAGPADPCAFSPGELEAWLREARTPVARLLATIRQKIDPADGRAALPALEEVDMVDALEHPRSSTCLRETSALDRVARTPLMAALMEQEGRSLFVRLLARVLDLLACLSPAPMDDAYAPAPRGGMDEANKGMGMAHAARGLLGHGARVEAGRVAAYRVISPSAWNLAEGGLLERALRALRPGADLLIRARLVISAVNPCVPVLLQPEEASHA